MEIGIPEDTDQSMEHPSSATGTSLPTPKVEGLEVDVRYPVPTQDPDDIPLDLYKEICEEIDAYKSNIGGDVSQKF